MNTLETLRNIEERIVGLTASPLYAARILQGYLPVMGQGNPHARIMFIGEAPGKREAETGTPFCGAAGSMLDALLSSIDVDRSDVYITNIVKDRPPENRDPTSEELALYAPFLAEEIEAIRPAVIVTLGRFAMRYIFEHFHVDSTGSISELHGSMHTCQAPYGPMQILVLYHPAAALYNGSLRKTLFTDIAKLTTA